MKVTLLSCGPSLSMYDPQKDDNDLVVAVNRAAEAYPCDWWAMLDTETMLFDANPREGIMTSTFIANKVVGNSEWGQYWRKGWKHLVMPRCNGMIGKTFPHTLWTIVYEFKPEVIDVWGCDMDGVEDYTGQTVDVRWNNDAKHRRSELRWEKEREYVMEQFKQYPVRWHRPDGVQEFPGAQYEGLEKLTGMPRRVQRIRLPREPYRKETDEEGKNAKGGG
jgi:hypothetical protein